MLPTVIGISGPAGCGKSTLAKLLVAKHGYTSHAMAEPMKSMLAELGVPHRNLYGTDDDKNEPLDILLGLSARRAMQTLGTEWGRVCVGENLWVNAWAARVVATAAGGVICEDVRYENEAAMIRSRFNGVVVGVRRPVEALAKMPDAAAEKHTSELGVLPDFTITNDGTPEWMLEQLLARCEGRSF